MAAPVLALEILYLIIDHVLESELQHYQHVFAPSTSSTAFELLATSHTFAHYLKQQDRFHRLRLWRLLNRIPRQFEPIQVAVGTMDAFTVLSIDMSTEKITNIPHTTSLHNATLNETETFLVLQETSSSIRSYRAHNDWLVYAKSRTTTTMTATSITTTSGCGILKGKKTKKDTDMGLVNDTNTSLTLALFPFSMFLRHIQWYALHHDASVWLWKRSTRFFKADNLELLLQQRFRYILDTPRHALIAWDRPHQHNFRFTENVLNSNVELFSKLLPSF